MHEFICLVCHFVFWILFSLTGLFGGYSLLPKQFYYVHDLMSWSQAQSYCKQKYTDLVFVYSEEDLEKLETSRPLLAYGYAWIGGVWYEIWLTKHYRKWKYHNSQHKLKLSRIRRYLLETGQKGLQNYIFILLQQKWVSVCILANVMWKVIFKN